MSQPWFWPIVFAFARCRSSSMTMSMVSLPRWLSSRTGRIASPHQETVNGGRRAPYFFEGLPSADAPPRPRPAPGRSPRRVSGLLRPPLDLQHPIVDPVQGGLGSGRIVSEDGREEARPEPAKLDVHGEPVLELDQLGVAPDVLTHGTGRPPRGLPSVLVGEPPAFARPDDSLPPRFRHRAPPGRAHELSRPDRRIASPPMMGEWAGGRSQVLSHSSSVSHLIAPSSPCRVGLETGLDPENHEQSARRLLFL